MINAQLLRHFPLSFNINAAFGIFALGAWIILADKILMTALLDPRWLIAILTAPEAMTANKSAAVSCNSRGVRV